MRLPPDTELHGRILRRSIMRAAPHDLSDRVWFLGQAAEYNITEPRLVDIDGISDNDKVTLFDQAMIYKFNTSTLLPTSPG